MEDPGTAKLLVRGRGIKILNWKCPDRLKFVNVMTFLGSITNRSSLQVPRYSREWLTRKCALKLLPEPDIAYKLKFG
jgi:hypothetical protein